MATGEFDEEIIQYSLKLPRELKEAYERRAKKNRRSLNQEFVIILERYLAAQESIALAPRDHPEGLPDTRQELFELRSPGERAAAEREVIIEEPVRHVAEDAPLYHRTAK